MATLTGMNAPIGHAVRIIDASAPPARVTSTERFSEAVDRIRNKSLPKPDDDASEPN